MQEVAERRAELDLGADDYLVFAPPGMFPVIAEIEFCDWSEETHTIEAFDPENGGAVAFINNQLLFDGQERSMRVEAPREGFFWLNEEETSATALVSSPNCVVNSD